MEGMGAGLDSVFASSSLCPARDGSSGVSVKIPGVIFIALLAFSTPSPAAARPAPHVVVRESGICGADSYINARGNCVHRPVFTNAAPADASARCRDGSYSFSQSRRGTCSHHGGVAEWL
jgi:hypothetical protein